MVDCHYPDSSRRLDRHHKTVLTQPFRVWTRTFRSGLSFSSLIRLKRSAMPALLRLNVLTAALRAAVSGLDDEQLDTPYREGGWSSRQVVHHLFDSHANAFIRFRLALTEDHPRITAYNEAL